MIVVSLPASQELGEKLGNLLGVNHERCTHKVFPDGESYLRFDFSVSGEEVIIVQTTYPDQNRRLLEIIMAAKALHWKGARKIHAVITYLAYARQDKEFLPGEVVSAKVVLEMLGFAGLNSLYVVDVHKPQILAEFHGEAHNIIAKETFAKYLRRQGLVDPVIVAPDVGAETRARNLAMELGTDYLVIRKYRDRVTGKVMHELPEDVSVSGRDAVVVDDIISTGGTMANIVSFLRGRGARKVYALASHGLLIGDAVGKLRRAGAEEIVVLNTVASRVEGVTYLDVSDELAKVLKSKLF